MAGSKDLVLAPGPLPVGIVALVTKPSTAQAAALAVELNTSGNADDNSSVSAGDLAADRTPNAVA